MKVFHHGHLALRRDKLLQLRRQLRARAALWNISTTRLLPPMFNPYYLTALPSWVLQPLATGAASVQASFGGSHSSALSLSVLDERVSLSSLALSVSGVTSSRGNTLDAIAGTTRAGAAQLGPTPGDLLRRNAQSLEPCTRPKIT